MHGSGTSKLMLGSDVLALQMSQGGGGGAFDYLV